MTQQLTPYLRDVVTSEFSKINTNKSIGVWKICALELAYNGMDSVDDLKQKIGKCKNMEKAKLPKKDIDKIISELSTNGFIDFVTNFKIHNTRPEITPMGEQVLQLYNKAHRHHVHRYD